MIALLTFGLSLNVCCWFSFLVATVDVYKETSGYMAGLP